MTLKLTKTMHPDDLVDLAPELVLVDQYFTSAREQHPARRWEYAMALRAARTYREQIHATSTSTLYGYDVGGAGSPFRSMIDADMKSLVLIVDPEATGEGILQQRLNDVVVDHPYLADVVFCLSVLEHVDDLDQFLYHLSCLVAPGGLLFLTMDCWDQEGPDTAHFHWMRTRIFTTWRCEVLASKFHDLFIFGTADFTYNGPQLYDYSFASLALVKRS